MSENYIDYDNKVQEALRSVVRSVLKQVEEEGVKGDHHFYVSFDTNADQVNIPSHLHARFPDEMTIVLQHKFWGLKVRQDDFEVVLSFNQQPETLVIPFSAIRSFVDPSVQFALQFHGADEDLDDSEDIDFEKDLTPEEIASLESLTPVPTIGQQPQSEKQDDGNKEAGKAEIGEKEDGGDNVVTLDAFRKK